MVLSHRGVHTELLTCSLISSQEMLNFYPQYLLSNYNLDCLMWPSKGLKEQGRIRQGGGHLTESRSKTDLGSLNVLQKTQFSKRTKLNHSENNARSRDGPEATAIKNPEIYILEDTLRRNSPSQHWFDTSICPITFFWRGGGYLALDAMIQK